MSTPAGSRNFIGQEHSQRKRNIYIYNLWILISDQLSHITTKRVTSSEATGLYNPQPQVHKSTALTIGSTRLIKNYSQTLVQLFFSVSSTLARR